MAETPPGPPTPGASAEAPLATPGQPFDLLLKGSLPLVFPFAEWIDKVVTPDLDSTDKLRRTIAGDTGSLAWELLTGDSNLNTRLDLLAQTIAQGNAQAAQDLIAQLKQDTQDRNAALTALGQGLITQMADPEAPLPAALKRIADQGDPDVADNQAWSAAIFDAMAAEAQAMGFPPEGEIATVTRFFKGAFARIAASGVAGATKKSGRDVLNVISGAEANTVAQVAALLPMLALLSTQVLINPLHALEGVQENFTGAFTGVHKQITDLLQQGDPQDLEAARTRAGRAAEIAMAAGLGAHLWAVLLERFAPGKNMGLGQLSGFMADMSSFQSITRGLWTYLIQAAVDRPLEQLYNQQFPTRIPPFGEILAMGRKHEYAQDPPVSLQELTARGIDASAYAGPVATGASYGVRTGFAADMLKQGIPMPWINRFWLYMWADPRLYDIVRMADTFLPESAPDPSIIPQLLHYAVDPQDPNWWMILKFKKAGYDSIDVPQLTQVALNRMIHTDKVRLQTQWRNSLRRGYIDVPTYRARMKELTQRDAAVDLQVEDVLMERIHDANQDREKRLVDSFLRNQITRADLQVGLAGFINDRGVLDQLLQDAQLQHDIHTRQHEDSRIAEETARVQTQAIAAYKHQLENDLITRETFIAQVIALGLREDLATLIADTHQALTAKRTSLHEAAAVDQERQRVLTLLTAAYADQYQTGLITEEQLKAQLIAAGLSEATAGAHLAREAAQKIRRLRQSTQTADLREAERLETALIERVRQQLLANLTTPENARAVLTSAGVPPARATEIVAAVAARLTRMPAAAAPHDRGPAAPHL